MAWTWTARLFYFVVFFAVALAVMLVARFCLFMQFRPQDVPIPTFFDSFYVGLRLDAKWLATLILPAWFGLLVSRFWPVVWKGAKVWLWVTSFAVVLANVINFGFYGFYGTTINSTIFGLWFDDTEAIVKTIWHDWPVCSYVVTLAVATLLPGLTARFISYPSSWSRLGWKSFVSVLVAGSIIIFVMIRGSLGTFPLRLQDFAASPHPYVNAVIPNGPAGLYYAYKEQKALSLGNDPVKGLREMGFASPQPAQEVIIQLTGRQLTVPLRPHADHVVFCLMESMGLDEFNAHTPGKNDTLGRLAQAIALPNAVVFRHALSVENGTFPTLEGLLFDTPLTPISQTKYGRESFSFSRLLLFQQAEYETVFLTSGSAQWHDLQRTFPLQGFDRVIGAMDIKAMYPQAEYGTWGVGDRWTFEAAKKLMQEADAKGKKLFLFILSATNHPPYKVPDGVETQPVDPESLPSFIVRRPETRVMLQTYQYAADALGGFLQWLQGGELGRKTLAVVTGDHNARLTYNDAAVWQHSYGVPVLFWLPQDLLPLLPQANPQEWISHRDLFPTMEALILGRQPEVQEGRNLFAPLLIDAATSWTAGEKGAVISGVGAVQMRRDGSCGCYAWQGNRLRATACAEELTKICQFGWAQRGLADYKIRKALLNRP